MFSSTIKELRKDLLEVAADKDIMDHCKNWSEMIDRLNTLSDDLADVEMSLKREEISQLYNTLDAAIQSASDLRNGF
jgi:hypothetical protein